MPSLTEDGVIEGKRLLALDPMRAFDPASNRATPAFFRPAPEFPGVVIFLIANLKTFPPCYQIRAIIPFWDVNLSRKPFRY